MATKSKTLKVKPKLLHTYVIKDESGNGDLLIAEHFESVIKMSLKLESEQGRKRLIGVIDEKERVMTIRRKRSKHLHYMSNSYGFNHFILDKAKLFDDVLLYDDYGAYRIPRKYILENGKFMNFKNNGGFELQIFLSLDLITEFTTKPKF
jgi:hypothetical protein